MDNPSDEQLLDAYFIGEAQAFHAFYRRHSGRVIGYALAKGLPQELAIDTCQDAFLKLHRFIHKYERGRPALPWFFSIVHHCVLDTIRKQQLAAKLKASLIHQSEPLSQQGDFTFETVKTLDEETTLALAELSHDQQVVMQMYSVEDLGFREIALVTGKSEVAVRKIFQRAKDKLRSFMVKDHPHGS